MKPISARDWVDDLSKEADKQMAKLCCTGLGVGHWQLEGGTHWCDVVVMRNRAISVWGDIEACTFAYCSGAKQPMDVISWMANADPHYYGAQKARIGMGDVGCSSYVPEVAVYDLERQREHAKECWEDGWEKPRRGMLSIKDAYDRAISNATRRIKNGDHFKFIHDSIFEELTRYEDDAWEWVYKIGEVTSPRVIYALAAIRRVYASFG